MARFRLATAPVACFSPDRVFGHLVLPRDLGIAWRCHLHRRLLAARQQADMDAELVDSFCVGLQSDRREHSGTDGLSRFDELNELAQRSPAAHSCWYCHLDLSCAVRSRLRSNVEEVAERQLGGSSCRHVGSPMAVRGRRVGVPNPGP